MRGEACELDWKDGDAARLLGGVFWEAAAELDPDAAKLDEGARFTLCRPEALGELFTCAGLSGVEVTAIDIQTDFATFDDYWSPFLGGQGPAAAYAMALDEAARTNLRNRIRARLPIRADGSIALSAQAWAVRCGQSSQIEQRPPGGGSRGGQTAQRRTRP